MVDLKGRASWSDGKQPLARNAQLCGDDAAGWIRVSVVNGARDARKRSRRTFPVPDAAPRALFVGSKPGPGYSTRLVAVSGLG